VQQNGLRTLLVAVPVAAALLFCGRCVSAQETAGVITSVSGTWLINGVKVRQGQLVPVGCVVQAKKPNARYGRIVIKLLDLTEINRICDRQGSCGDPLELPDAVVPRSRSAQGDQQPLGFWDRFILAIVASRRPEYRRILKRGGSDFRDQVVILRNGQLDLTSVFAGHRSHQFSLNIEPINGRLVGVSSTVIERPRLNWNTYRRAIIEAPAMTPGLYRVTLSEPEGSKTPGPPVDVWILVVEPARYPQAAAEYRRARSATAGWSPELEIRADDLLRAFLDASVVREKR
jgi:hypothetical protein